MLRRTLPIALALTSSTLVGGSIALLAAEPTPSMTPLVAQDGDTMLALRVTGALHSDAELRDLAVTVDVRRGVVTLGGELADADLLPKLRRVAGQVPGVTGVNIDCRISEGGGDEAYINRVGELLAGKVRRVRPAVPPVALPRLVHLPAIDPDRRAEARHRVERPPTPADRVGGGFLLDPVAPSSPAGVTSPERDAEAIRAGDPRYAGLALTFRGAVVVVSGRAATHADVADLQLALRRVPGVERVRRGSVVAD